MCPTSNLMTLGLTDLHQHPVLSQLPDDLQYSINTDDPFIFAITLSDELHLVSSLFSWSMRNYIQFLESVKEQVLDKSPATHDSIEAQIAKCRKEC